MQLVCDGVSDKEIARRLDLSEDAVKVHVHNIYQKLAMRNREALRGRSAE
jgi:DNA-binding NarL/FixJ family response regulator